MVSKSYAVVGMTCGSCVARVQEALVQVDGVKKVEVQLDFPQVVVTSDREISFDKLASAVKKVGNYELSTFKIEKELKPLPVIKSMQESPSRSLSTYKPLILIVGFIFGVCLLVQYPFDQFLGMVFMRHFMAGFFIVFSFFKFLNIQGFAKSFAMYDVIAARWKFWGFVYPFVELVLGLFYLIDVCPVQVNWVTVLVLGVGTVGVIQSNLSKKKIKCACLGDVFNLPMSAVTIIENLVMIFMSILVLANFYL